MSSASDNTEAALPATEHMLGDAHASVTLVEFGDYECPACIQAEPLVRHMLESFAQHVRFVFRHFPLMEVHPHAELAAEAAEAAAAQGQFWPMHHRLFSQPHHLDMAGLSTHAQALGLDMVRFNAEMADHIYTQRVQEHRRAGELMGVRATPTFFLDGKLVDVSFGFDKLEAALHAAVKGQGKGQ